jgi:hypothetical protein
MNYEDFINLHAPSLELKDSKGILDLSKKQILDSLTVTELLNGPSVGIYTDPGVRGELSTIAMNLQKVHQMIQDHLEGKHEYQKRTYIYTTETLTFKNLFETVQNLATRTQ